MLGREASKVGKGGSKAGSGRLNGDMGSCEPVVCGKLAWGGTEWAAGIGALYGESEGVPVKEVASTGKLTGTPEPDRRAKSASLGSLS